MPPDHLAHTVVQEVTSRLRAYRFRTGPMVPVQPPGEPALVPPAPDPGRNRFLSDPSIEQLVRGIFKK